MRQGLLEKAQLGPSRADLRTSLTNNSAGVTHVHKLKGRDVCGIKVDADEVFNDLDLVPIVGSFGGFDFGDVKSSDNLLSKNGQVKNSNAQEWSISD